MVDEDSHNVASETAGGAPVNRDKRSEPMVIEGEMAAQGEAEDAPAAPHPGETAPSGEAGDTAPTAGEAAAPAPSRGAVDDDASGREAKADRSRRTGRGGALLAGALGGLVVSAIIGGIGYALLAPSAELAEGNARRLAAIETQAQREDAAIAGVDKRLGALEGSSSTAAVAAVDKRLSGLQATNETIDKRLGALQEASDTVDKRLGALEAAHDALDKRLAGLQAANTDAAPGIAAATQGLQTLTGEVKNLRAEVEAARGEIPGLAARVAKLESGPSQATAADLASVTARLDKIDAQLAATTNETRTALEKASASDNPAAVAIVAGSLRDRLARGAPFKTELEGLERLGIEPDKLSALKAVADGAPTDSALAADFDAVQSKVLAAAAPAEQRADTFDRLVAHLRGLVQVRNLNEATGEDPQALVSRIEADSRRGDVSDALAAFAKLPEPSRQAASDWASAAEARLAAEKALQSIRETAVAQLAESGKP